MSSYSVIGTCRWKPLNDSMDGEVVEAAERGVGVLAQQRPQKFLLLRHGVLAAGVEARERGRPDHVEQQLRFDCHDSSCARGGGTDAEGDPAAAVALDGSMSTSVPKPGPRGSGGGQPRRRNCSSGRTGSVSSSRSP